MISALLTAMVAVLVVAAAMLVAVLVAAVVMLAAVLGWLVHVSQQPQRRFTAGSKAVDEVERSTTREVRRGAGD